MKGGSVVALMVLMAMMSVGKADNLLPDCPSLCGQLCGGAVGREPDNLCTAACQTVLCALWPTPPSPPSPSPSPPADPPVPNADCPTLCSKVCGIIHDPNCDAVCQKLFCPLQAAPPTAQP